MSDHQKRKPAVKPPKGSMKARIWNHQSWIKITDLKKLKEMFQEMLERSGFQILAFNDFQFQPQGYSALWLLAESHFALHTFPEQGWTYCELSSCNREKFVKFLGLVDPYEE